MSSQNGLTCKIESGDGRRASATGLFDSIGALLFYAALWGGLCSMASLSAAGALPLTLGGLFALALVLMPQHKPLWWGLFVTGIAAAAVLLVVRRQVALDGMKLLLNRLFAASEARQAYTYEMCSVAAAVEDWQGCIQYALAPLGIVTGLACGAAVRRRLKLLLAVMFFMLTGLAAYLGVSPGIGCSILLAAALALTLLEIPAKGAGTARLPACIGVLVILALVSAVVLAVMPGEDARLSAWDEQARDILALQTVAYADQRQPGPAAETKPPEEDRQFYREEETSGRLGGGETEWSKPLSVILVVLLFALLLFFPALLSDLQKKRRARNRKGLDDPNPNVSIQAMFLYTLRWLRLGGLTPANIPFSGYTMQIEAIFSEDLRIEFEAVLPLWQEAAYSAHRMDEAQRMQMRRFMDAAKQSVWDGLSKKKRILAHYIYAL